MKLPYYVYISTSMGKKNNSSVTMKYWCVTCIEKCADNTTDITTHTSCTQLNVLPIIGQIVLALTQSVPVLKPTSKQ